ncbi:PREDICTED: testican-2-like isoform X1 [Branchiostoma belcheri]|uniref:Testican-2-like isoform X1 n=1 Tax=Branchiostoma belcheri TaxID=7741 RepID=A0A6P4YC12_BRABE|nr:PREDICTED: testican-2-like isoform X1 [Branchiostoma belcheri]
MAVWRLTVAVLVALTLVQARDLDDVKPGSDPKIPDSNAAETRDVCENFKCRKPPGAMCTVDYSKGNPRPKCICPTNCPREMEPVCSVYGRTYDNMCRLHVEACRKKRRIEVAYQGECIAKQEPCTEYEKSQFPIRLMEWFFHLKEIDEFGQLSNITSGATLVMTDRERAKLAKWKYDQLDRKGDGKLGRRDLKDFRYALMPMEHCAEAFFRKCDTNKDKGVNREEWYTCLGVYRDEEEKKMQMDMLVEPEALEVMVETNFKEMLDKLPDPGMPPASPPQFVEEEDDDDEYDDDYYDDSFDYDDFDVIEDPADKRDFDKSLTETPKLKVKQKKAWNEMTVDEKNWAEVDRMLGFDWQETKPDSDEPEAGNWALVDKMLKGQADQPAELVEGSKDEEILEDDEEEEDEEEEEEKLSPEEKEKMEKKRRRQERRRLRKLEREKKEQEKMD